MNQDEARPSDWIGWLSIALLGTVVLGFGVYCANHSVDFPVYYRTALQLLHRDYEIYPTALDDGKPVPSHGFRYAPAIAFLFLPFGLMRLQAAVMVFFAMKVAALIWVTAVVRRYAGLSGGLSLPVMSLILVGGYAVEEFRYGNFHFFSVALMVLAFDAAESDRVGAAAGALGVAIAAKLSPILLLAYFALRRRFAVCIATFAVLLALAIVPAAIVGFKTNAHLLEGFAKYAVEKIDEGDNYALRGVLVRAGLPAPTVSVIWMVSIVAGGIVVAAVLRRPPSSPTTRLLELCVVLTATLLASPHTQRRYFVALYVPVMALVGLMMKEPGLRERALIRVALVVTATTGTVLPLLVAGRAHALAYEAGSPYFFGTLTLFVILVVVTARLKAAERQHRLGEMDTT